MKSLPAILAAACIAHGMTLPARADIVTDWNQTAVRATEVAQLPPPPQARVMALVHAAIYDAVIAIDRRHAHYAVDVKAANGASIDAAAAAAAHGILSRVFPMQLPSLDAALATSLAALPGGDAREQGAVAGREVAARLFEMRKGDGAAGRADYVFASAAGAYQKTPPGNAMPVLPHWRQVKTFILRDASQFAPPGPPAPGSAEFARDFEEVKRMGSRHGSPRTSEQTAIALFWAGSEIPPLNTVARAMSAAKGLSAPDNARLFAHLNLAMADALIAGFESKYKTNSWRPVTAIRTVAAQPGVVPDPAWEPLMVTPPHPDYPSAHCLATGAAASVLEGFLGTDRVQVSLVQPPLGLHRRYESLPELVKEMEDARVWGGIHFRTADEHGTRMGRLIAEHSLRNFLQPAGAAQPR